MPILCHGRKSTDLAQLAVSIMHVIQFVSILTYIASLIHTTSFSGINIIAITQKRLTAEIRINLPNL